MDENGNNKFKVNKSYIERLDEHKIYKRFYNLQRQALRIKRVILRMDKDASYDDIEAAPGIAINEALLFGAIESYWFDIFRLRDFHNDEEGLVNRPRKAAYTIKWIVKYKPISFDPRLFTEPIDTSFLPSINEFFALRAGMRLAGISDNMIDDESVDRFIYNLGFRPFDEGFVSFWFMSFMKHHNLEIE